MNVGFAPPLLPFRLPKTPLKSSRPMGPAAKSVSIVRRKIFAESFSGFGSEAMPGYEWSTLSYSFATRSGSLIHAASRKPRQVSIGRYSSISWTMMTAGLDRRGHLSSLPPRSKLAIAFARSSLLSS